MTGGEKKESLYLISETLSKRRILVSEPHYKESESYVLIDPFVRRLELSSMCLCVHIAEYCVYVKV